MQMQMQMNTKSQGENAPKQKRSTDVTLRSKACEEISF